MTISVETVLNLLSKCGYGPQQIATGAAYADRIGHQGDGRRFMSLALARIRWSEQRLAQAERERSWHPVDLDWLEQST